MKAPTFITTPLLVIVLAVTSAIALLNGQATGRAGGSREAKRWTDTFDTPACRWSSTGRNDFFMLEPGDQSVFEGREDGAAVKLVITVTNEIRKVGTVDTRIVEERETHNGQLIEVSRNYFALCGPSNDVFYFGEDVDMYKNGRVDNHEGSWIAETAGAKPGLFIPSRPLMGSRYYQEVAAKVAMDRVEIISDTEVVKTPFREFREAVKTEETTPLEPGATENKIYARGVGLIQDGPLMLTQHGTVQAAK